MALLQEFVPANKSQQDLKSFRCGKETMDTFLHRFACRDMGLGISTTWVLLDETEEKQKPSVAAYYTLGSATVKREDIPTAKKHPPYALPVVLLAKLAIDSNFQKQRLGEKVLIEALRHSVTLTKKGLPAIGLILDVLDEDALAFYQRFEIFETLTENPDRLFVPMDVLTQL